MASNGGEASGHRNASSNVKRSVPFIAPGDLEYVAALALAAGLNALPSAIRASVIHRLSRWVGTVLHMTNRGTVRRVRRHLQYLFPSQASGVQLESLVREQLVMSSWNAFILNLLPSLRDEYAAGLLEVEGSHYLDGLRKRGERVLLLGAHYGAYGYAVVAALSARGHPIWLVGYGDSRSPPPQTSYLYNKLYWPRVQRLNQRLRVTTVVPGAESQSELAGILERGTDVVYLLPDQYFVVRPGQDCPSNLVPLRLLNHTVYLDVSGLQLAKQMGCRPLTAMPVNAGPAPQRILIEPIEWVSDGTTTADIGQDLQAFLSRLEGRLLAYPAWWRDLRRRDLFLRLGVFEGEGSAGERNHDAINC